MSDRQSWGLLVALFIFDGALYAELASIRQVLEEIRDRLK
jgi:hypothetical protein